MDRTLFPLRPRTPIAAAALALACVVNGACGSDAPAPAPTSVRMQFTRPDFYAAPVPSDDMVAADGHVDLTTFPNPYANLLVDQLKGIVTRDARGFATTAGVFFSLTDDVDPKSLPDLTGSIAAGASVSLVSVSRDAPDFGKPIPSFASFLSDGGEYGAPHLLSVVPLGGTPLRPKTTYAALVTTAVTDVAGHALGASTEMAQLLHGVKPLGMPDAAFATYSSALDALSGAGTDTKSLVGLAVFTTGDPTQVMRDATAFALSQPLPALTQKITKSDTFPTYCVYNTQLSMPDYQQGTPPFSSSGGDWAFDTNGHPIVQRNEPARIVLTVPRAPMPAAGYPLLVLVRTGAGGDRPLVDRGVQAMTGGPPIMPGTGPALELAKVGYAGAQIDGPHGGLRNVTMGDEQFLMFNVSNGYALRDNVRESALEISVFEKVLEGITFDASDCMGASATVKFDVTKVALMGHSMGATIAPLALAVAPPFKGVVLSGAGASWIENVLFKKEPLVVRPIMETLFGYSSQRRTLTRGDPVLSLMQWAIEPADPLVYTRSLISEPPNGQSPRQILMEQGIVDHYIMPPIANATSLSLGLDIGGKELDATNAELLMTPDLLPLSSVLPFSGRSNVAFPVSANVSKDVTAIVVQHPSDGIEDGHEVMFQTDPPKQEYRCFLQSLAKGGAAKVPDGTIAGACP
jgi:hypothetical protein